MLFCRILLFFSTQFKIYLSCYMQVQLFLLSYRKLIPHFTYPLSQCWILQLLPVLCYKHHCSNIIHCKICLFLDLGSSFSQNNSLRSDTTVSFSYMISINTGRLLPRQLHSLQQCPKILISVHPCQHFVLSTFLIFAL